MWRPPAFWDDPSMGWQALMLLPASIVYSIVAARRMRRMPDRAVGVPVICIGNPTVGGAGKTPTAIHVARRLIARGRNPVFLSRGYGGTTKRPTVVDPVKHRAGDVGDEPLLLAEVAPTVVAADRAAGALRAERLGDVIVMDDGFQNPSLAKDLPILVIDDDAGLGNGMPLPAGPLRAPLGNQIGLARALLLIGSGGKAQVAERAAEMFRLPILRGSLVPDPDVSAQLAGRAVIAFAGIGRPEKFFKTLETTGARIVRRTPFADHHPYSEDEASALIDAAAAADARLVTTEKDLARLSGGAGALAALQKAATALPVRLEIEDASQAELDRLIDAALAAKAR